MSMTEKEAKEKWCPFFQASATPADQNHMYSIIVNRPRQDQEQNSLCIGSRCMCWRWDRLFNDDVLDEQRRAWVSDACVDQKILSQQESSRQFINSEYHKTAMDYRSGDCGLCREDKHG